MIPITVAISVVLFASGIVAVPFAARIPTCGYLKDPDGGYVSYTGKRFGSKAFYSCRNGYKRGGNNHRVCQYDGTWSGEEPRCLVGKLAEAKSCKSLNSYNNICAAPKKLTVGIWKHLSTVLSDTPEV